MSDGHGKEAAPDRTSPPRGLVRIGTPSIRLFLVRLRPRSITDSASPDILNRTPELKISPWPLTHSEVN